MVHPTRTFSFALMTFAAIPARAAEQESLPVVVKLHTYPIVSQLGYGSGSGAMIFLIGGSAEVELFEWAGVEVGSDFVFGNIEGTDRDFFARAGVVPTLLDRRRGGVEGYVLGLDGYVGYHNFTRFHGDNEGNSDAREHNHALQLATGADNTWWWSRYFGLTVRILVSFSIPLGQSYDGFWTHTTPERSYGVSEDERTDFLFAFNPSVGVAF